MSQKTKVNKVVSAKTKPSTIKGGQYSLVIILVMTVLIIIPLSILGSVVYESYMKAGVPIIGQRFDGDLKNKISPSQLSSIDNSVKNLSGVTSVTSDLQTATLKVYVDVDVDDNVARETYPTIVQSVYEQVTSLLPVETYFSRLDGIKNYDLELNVVSNLTSPTIYYIGLKTSNLESLKVQDVSTPLSESVVEEIQNALDQRNALRNQAKQIQGSNQTDSNVQTESIENVLEDKTETPTSAPTEAPVETPSDGGGQ